MSRFIQVSSIRIMHMKAGHLFSHVTAGDLGQIRRFVRESAAASGCDPQVVDELIVAVNEAVANIVRHGYLDEPGEIEVSMRGSEEAIVVVLLDHGLPFDPTTVLSPDTALPLAERPFGGMGVHFMREFCDELSYRREPGGRNELTLSKRFNPHEEGNNR